MASIIRPHETQIRVKKTTAIEQASGGTLWQVLHAYAIAFNPGTNLVDDNELGGNRHNAVDPTKQAEGLPTPSGSMTVALDLNQLPWWLRSLTGAVVTDDADDPVFEHVMESGLTAPALLHIEQQHASGTFTMCDSQAVSQITFPFADEDGIRKLELAFIGRSVRPSATGLASSPAAAPARDKLQATVGLVKVNGVNLGNIVGGSMTLSNGAFFERYGMDDSKWPSAVEIGLPSAQVSPELRVRSDVQATLNLFDGVTPFTLEVLYQMSADRLLKFEFPQVVANPVALAPSGVNAMSISPTFMASQTDSAPMYTVTVRNSIEAY